MINQSTHQLRIPVADKRRGNVIYDKSTFQKPGFRIHAIDSYVEAISCLTSHQFHPVIEGQVSPRLEAKKALQQNLEIDRGLPVLVLTRHLDKGCYLEVMQLGAVDYFEKLLKPKEIIRVVKALWVSSPLALAKVGAESRGEI